MPALIGSGRKRKDPALAAAEGDRGHKGNKPPYSRALVATPPGAPDLPAVISAGAAAIWHQIVPLLASDPNLLSVVDTSILRDFCEVEVQKQEIEASMWEAAAAAEKAAPKGQKRQARAAVIKDPPLQRTLDGLRMRQTILRRELGLTPAARSALKVGPIITSKSIQSGDIMEEAFFGGSMKPV